MHEESLIIRYLGGEASPDEAIQLESWLHANGTNQQAFDRFWQSWQQASARDAYLVPDAIAEWQLFRQRLSGPGAPPAAARAPFLLRYLLIGSGIAVVLTALWILLSPDTKTPPVMVRSTVHGVAPGVLPDSSRYTLDEHSRLAYSEDITAGNSELVLTGGLMLNNGKAEKITRLKVGSLLLEARPGNYYIAYDSLIGKSEIYVAEGSVKVHSAEGDVLLEKGASFLFDEQAQRRQKDFVMDKNKFSFATRSFYFNNTPLSEVIVYLEKAYGITIRMQHTTIGNCRLTGQFNYVPVEHILDMLTYSFPITFDYKKSEKTVYLSGNGCD